MVHSEYKYNTWYRVNISLIQGEYEFNTYVVQGEFEFNIRYRVNLYSIKSLITSLPFFSVHVHVRCTQNNCREV